jgi:hypothetical protein
VRIVAAANPPDMVAGGWELSPPLSNRFIHVRWQLPGNVFADALQQGFPALRLPEIDGLAHAEAAENWKMVTSAFLRRNPAMSHTQPAEGEYAFASPRTWDYAIHLMASCEVLGKAARPGGRGSAIFYNLVESSVGSGAAKSFAGFLKKLRLPDPEKVLDGKEPVPVETLEDDELYILFCSLSSSLMRRKQKRRGSPFLDATLTVLSLVEEVNAAHRVDTVFAPVRQMARGQILQTAAAAARDSGRLPELRSSLNRVFDHTPLAEFVSILD